MLPRVRVVVLNYEGGELTLRCLEALEGGDLAALDPRGRGDAGDPGGAVDQDRAAAALALGRASVLGRAQTEVVAKDGEEARAGWRADLDRPSVAGEPQAQ